MLGLKFDLVMVARLVLMTVGIIWAYSVMREDDGAVFESAEVVVAAKGQVGAAGRPEDVVTQVLGLQVEGAKCGAGRLRVIVGSSGLSDVRWSGSMESLGCIEGLLGGQVWPVLAEPVEVEVEFRPGF